MQVEIFTLLVNLRRLRREDEIGARQLQRSEEHTSELQSQSNLVCRLLLEKKNTQVDDLVRPLADRLPLVEVHIGAYRHIADALIVYDYRLRLFQFEDNHRIIGRFLDDNC